MRSTLPSQDELIEEVTRRPLTRSVVKVVRPEAERLDIGSRLLAVRKERGLSLQDMSRLTGVSASACSKIERNELSPTISTMQRLAEGLGIELVTLLSEPGSGVAPVAGRRSVTRAGEGNDHRTGTCDNALLCSDLKDKLVTPIVTRVRARSTDEYDAWAKSEADIFLTVLEGVLVVHSAIYEPLTLSRGDSVYYSAQAEHAWTSAGPDDAVVLWIIASKGQVG